MKTFEEYLEEIAPSEVHTNNDPAGFERWLEQLDTQEVMDYAQGYGEYAHDKGYEIGKSESSN